MAIIITACIIRNNAKRGVKMHGAVIFSFFSHPHHLSLSLIPELLFFGRNQMGTVKKGCNKKILPGE